MLSTRKSTPRSSRQLDHTKTPWRKLQWHGHVSHSAGLGKTILQGTMKGGRRQGRERKRWEDNIRNGQAWSSASPRGQQRTGKSGGKWLQNHLWCPSDPCVWGIDDDDDVFLSVQMVVTEKEDTSQCYRWFPSWTHFFHTHYKPFTVLNGTHNQQLFHSQLCFSSLNCRHFCTTHPGSTYLIKNGQQFNTCPNLNFSLSDLWWPSSEYS